SELCMHRFEARRIDRRAAVPARCYQPRHPEAVEMKCEGVRRKFESGGDLACGQPVRTCLHQKPESVETIILGKRCKSCYGIYLFHISMDIEQSAGCQVSFR